jgi:hypothetical protein
MIKIYQLFIDELLIKKKTMFWGKKIQKNIITRNGIPKMSKKEVPRRL